MADKLKKDTWINLGDVSPEQGTVLMRNAEIINGAFEAEIVESICETAIGGDETRFLLRSGALYLDDRNMASALQTIGAKIDGRKITLEGGSDVDMASDEGLITLFHAAQGSSNMDVDCELLVKIGKAQAYDQDVKFDTERHGEFLQVRAGTSLWSVMRNRLDGFDYHPPKVLSAADRCSQLSNDAVIMGAMALSDPDDLLSFWNEGGETRITDRGQAALDELLAGGFCERVDASDPDLMVYRGKRVGDMSLAAVMEARGLSRTSEECAWSPLHQVDVENVPEP